MGSAPILFQHQLRVSLSGFGYRYVRFGSKADIRAAKGHVCFTPESGQGEAQSECPLWAISGHDTPANAVKGHGPPLSARTARIWGI